MTPIIFTHTAYKTDVVIFAEQVVAILFLPAMKSTVVVGPGSTAVPVVGTVEEVTERVRAAIAAAQPNSKEE